MGNDYVTVQDTKGKLVLAYSSPHSYYGIAETNVQSVGGDAFLVQFKKPYLCTDVMPNQAFLNDPSWSFEFIQKMNDRELCLYGRMEPGEVVCLAKEVVFEPKVKLCGEWPGPRRT